MDNLLKTFLGIGAVAVIATNSFGDNLEAKIDTVYGYGPNKTIAIKDGRRKILEKKGIWLKSETTIEEFVLTKDKINEEAEGKVVVVGNGGWNPNTKKIKMWGYAKPKIDKDAKNLYNSGMRALNENKLENAIYCFKNVIDNHKKFHGHANAMYGLFSTYLRMGRTGYAEEIFFDLKDYHEDSQLVGKAEAELGPAFYEEGEKLFNDNSVTNNRYTDALEYFEKSYKYNQTEKCKRKIEESSKKINEIISSMK